MLALFLRDLADHLPEVLLQLRLIVEVLDNQPDDTSADSGRVLVQSLGPALALGRRTQLGVAHLDQLLFLGSGGHLAPRRRDIVQVPMFEGEPEAGTQRSRLTEDRQAFGAQLLDPPQSTAMDFAVITAGGDRL